MSLARQHLRQCRPLHTEYDYAQEKHLDKPGLRKQDGEKFELASKE